MVKNFAHNHVATFVLSILLLLGVGGSAVAQVDSVGANESWPLALEIYGEILLQHFDYGPDRKSDPNGSQPDSRTTVDIPRVVFELEYEFDPTFLVEIELEIEHAGTGGAVELEYEEFGEYEQEVEKGGEVVLEKVVVEAKLTDDLTLAAGRLILPIGLLNKHHDPNQFFGTVYSESDGEIIPLVWNEIGLSAFGSIGPFDWKLMLVNGLDATGFTSEHWIVEGHQKKFEVSKATDPAVVARIDYQPTDGVRLGASFYRGNSTKNRPKGDIESLSGTVTIFEGDLSVERGPLVLRGSFIDGSLSDAAEISAKNSRISRNLTVPRTPVASGASAVGLELGFDLFNPLGLASNLFAFARYDRYNSMARVDGLIFPDPRFDRVAVTAGFNYMPTKNIVVKADYSHRSLGESGRLNSENTIGLAIGFIGQIMGDD